MHSMNSLPFAITSDAIGWIRERVAEVNGAQGAGPAFLTRLCLVSSIRESDESGNIVSVFEGLHLGLGFDQLETIEELNLGHFLLEGMTIYIDSAAVNY